MKCTQDMANNLDGIRQQLRALADPKRAEGEKKYLKSPMKHYGLTVPQLHKIAKNWVKENSALSIDEVINFIHDLWESEWHEERWLATDILTERRGDLTMTHLPEVEHMVKTAIGWAQLDDIAAWLVGTLYEKDPVRMSQVFRKWITENNFWVQRAALLGQLVPLREGRGDFALFRELSTPLLTEKEFFIRKAIGWVLRERAKKNPLDTFSYVKKYGHQMSGLTYREATRRLPEDLHRQLSDTRA
jgi:3-methyladenine DNA glycosylase AlkD